MPPISKKKQERIQEQILHHLFEISPESTFTSKIAEVTARDEGFIKTLLTDLKSKKLITEINKNSSGMVYKRRQRWRLSNKAFEVFNNNNP